MDELQITEFDLTSQQIVFLNDIAAERVSIVNDLPDFINSPMGTVVDDEYEPFEEIPELPSKSDHLTVNDHEFHIIQNSDGIRHLKFKKPKKSLKKSSCIKKLVDQQQCCTICSMQFPSAIKLKKHIQGHARQKKHQCDVCSEEFNVLENLTLHISLHKGDGRCPQCGKIFRRLASLEGHIKTHFKNEYFMCTQGCGEMFHFEWMLKQHMNEFHANENSRLQQEKEELAKTRRQTRKNQLNCKYCGKKFSKNCLLIRHERIHNGERPFRCDQCSRSFAQKNTLIIHQRRHNAIHPFSCNQCPQSFAQKGNLVSHMAKCHTYREGETSFSCNKCSCCFKKIGTLNAHISKFHTSQGVFMQTEPDLGFTVDEVMQQLNELHRPNFLENELVSKELFFNLPAPEPKSPQENTETIYADNRDLTASLQSSLKLAVHSNGMVTHCNVMQRIDGNVRWYICLYCPKEFRRPSDLVRHIRIHTKEKPYTCPVADCSKQFAVKSSLNMHINTHLKSSKEHTCHVCPQIFDSADSFDEHCRLFHMEHPIFQCFICSQLCITNGELKHHLKCHRSSTKAKKISENKDDDDGIQLDIIMKEPILLTNEGKIEEPVEKNVCDQERKFECTVCTSSFKRKGHLKEHILSHLGLKSFKCTYDSCEKSFGKMSILKRHLLYHSNEKKFQCGICNASFISNNQLKRHSLKHTTQRNVMCPYCQKRFKSKATCRTHMLIHKTEWVKQFKEQLKAGKIQIDNGLNPSNESVILDIMAPSTHESVVETLHEIPNDSLYSNNEGAQDITRSVFLPNLVQENSTTNSDNQFEYFLLLPTNPETSENAAGNEINAVHEQFVVNDESLSFINMHFIQLEQSSLFNHIPETSASNQLSLNYQLDSFHTPNTEHIQPRQLDLNADLIHLSTVAVSPTFQETPVAPINAYSSPPNENSLKSTNTRTRRFPKGENKCETCSKIFQKPIDLRRHIRTHTLEKPFNCTICSKSFGLKSTLKNHLKTHDDIKQMFPCTVCWKAYSSRHSMLTHMLIHSNTRPYKCEYCTIAFRTRGHLTQHQSVHLRESKKHGVSPSDIKTRKEKAKLQQLLNVVNEYGTNCNNPIEFSDTVRVDRLETSAEILNNMNVCDPLNAEKIIHQCTCQEQFSDFNEFKVHLKTHKEMFRCTECDKEFKKPSLLKRHQVVHSGRKEFVCSICQKSYTQKATLQAHMSLHTADGASFECTKCHKKFNFETNLTSHERKCKVLNNNEELIPQSIVSDI